MWGRTAPTSINRGSFCKATTPRSAAQNHTAPRLQRHGQIAAQRSRNSITRNRCGRGILNIQAQQKREDNEGPSGSQMAANLSTRSAAISRYETDYAEEFQSRSATVQTAGASVTDATFGGDDYMAAYGSSGGNLTSAFGAAADPANKGLREFQAADAAAKCAGSGAHFADGSLGDR